MTSQFIPLTLDDIADYFDKPIRYGKIRIPCPVHGGEDDNLAVAEKGGTLVVYCHSHQCDRTEILRALRELIRPQNSLPPKPPTHTTARVNSQTEKSTNEEQDRIAFAKRLWNAAQVADGTPARAYLAGRLAWPPDGIGPPLPQTVRWLPGTKTGGMLHLPHDAAGYLLFAWHSHPAGDVRAVSCEALTHNGERLDKLPDRKRVRLTHGVRKNAAFVVNAGASKLLIMEGEVDALAARWLYPDHEARAVGGTAGLKNWNGAPGDCRPVQIVADGDSTGRRAGELARESAKTAGHQAIINWSPVGKDLADELAVTLAERIAIVEAEPRVTHREATRLGWQQLLERA